MTTMLVEVLESYGFAFPLGSDQWNDQPAFIESFEVGNLQHASTITELPLIQLIDEADLIVPDTGKPYSRYLLLCGCHALLWSLHLSALEGAQRYL